MRKLALLLLLPIAGCGGKPTTYLTLAPAAPDVTQAAYGPSLAVDPVSIPPDIDRNEFTSATGDATLRVESNVRWAAPLDELIQSALARDLAARLPRTRVLMPGDPVPQTGTREVHVTVATLIANGVGTVTLEADWSVTPPGSPVPLAQDRFRLSLPGSATPAAEAGTMSDAIGRLADAIAQAVQ